MLRVEALRNFIHHDHDDRCDNDNGTENNDGESNNLTRLSRGLEVGGQVFGTIQGDPGSRFRRDTEATIC